MFSICVLNCSNDEKIRNTIDSINKQSFQENDIFMYFNSQQELSDFQNDFGITEKIKCTMFDEQVFTNSISGLQEFVLIINSGDALTKNLLWSAREKILQGNNLILMPIASKGENGEVFYYNDDVFHICDYSKLSTQEICEEYEMFANRSPSWSILGNKIISSKILSKYEESYKTDLIEFLIKNSKIANIKTDFVILHTLPNPDSSLYKNKTNLYPLYSQYEALVEAIVSPNTKHILFDVFDTLILRPVMQPNQLFYFLGFKYSELRGFGVYNDFEKLRRSATKQLHALKHIEHSLKDVYSMISSSFDISPELTEQMLQYEYELEIKYCYARETGKLLFNLAKHYGKNVACLSDMYLPSEIIKKMLISAGYPELDVFVSNEIKASKWNGSAYPFILNQYNSEEPKEFVMIGDNHNNDVLWAQWHKLQAFHLPRTIELFNESNAYKLIKNDKFPYYDVPAECLLAVSANSLFDFPFIPNYNDVEQYGYRNVAFFGKVEVATYVLSFVFWLIEHSKHKKYDKLAFCSRDTGALKHAYDRTREFFPDLPPSTYFHFSKESALMLTLGEDINIQSLLDSIYLNNFDSIKNTLNFFKNVIQEDVFKNAEKIFADAGLDLNSSQEKNDIKLFYSVLKIIKEQMVDEKLYKLRYKKLVEYVESNLTSSSCLIESGYSGRMENGFAQLGINVDAYYFLAKQWGIPNWIHRFKRSELKTFANIFNAELYFKAYYEPHFSFIDEDGEKVFLPTNVDIPDKSEEMKVLNQQFIRCCNEAVDEFFSIFGDKILKEFKWEYENGSEFIKKFIDKKRWFQF